MLDRPDAADLRRQFARTVGVRRAVVEGRATAAPEADSSPVLDGVLAELRRALAREAVPGERLSPVEAALAAVLSCPGERVPASPKPGPADAAEDDGSDAAAATSGTAEAEGATGREPGSRSGVAPAPEDHAFSDMPHQATRERDVPLAMFTDPGVVAPADRELAHALVLIERAGGQNARQAKLAVRQLLAERDRVLHEPAAMRLPPIAPEKLTGVVRSLAATLEQGLATPSETLPTTAPPAQAQSVRLGAPGPAQPAQRAGRVAKMPVWFTGSVRPVASASAALPLRA